MSYQHGTDHARLAREACVERKGKCGRDCPQALESMGWKCMIREIPEVAMQIGVMAYRARKEARQEARKAQQERSPAKRISRETVWAILDALAAGKQGRQIAQDFGINESTVSMIKSGATRADAIREWKARQAG
jgi:hypothetical protein